MNVVVFGASGGTGAQVVRQALAQGRRVTAFVRDGARLPLQHSALRVLVGDVFDGERVSQAVAGQAAVVVALGSRGRRNGKVRSGGTARVIQAMNRHRVSRLVVVSAGGVGDSYRQAPWVVRLIIRTALRHTYADHEQQEHHVRQSGLDWVIVRPARLIDGPATGRYHVASASARLAGGQVSRADVAGFVLKQLTDDRFLRQAVSIA
jgi:putative NADH-flavin reductase